MKALLFGVSLGWAAGISPGPLMMFVITTALKKGARAGMHVALAPFLTDTPMLIVGVLTASVLSGGGALTALTVAGGVYLIWLGVFELRHLEAARIESVSGAGDLRRAVWLNLTSPHPWVFWLTVGGPFVARADTGLEAAGFLAGFYVLLVGTKLVTAFVVGSNSHRLPDRVYRWLVLSGAAGLVLFGVLLLVDAIVRG